MLLKLAACLAIALFLAACGGNDEAATPTAIRPSATPTATVSNEVSPTLAPSPTSTLIASPTATPDPSELTTGIPAVDAVTEAVLTRDRNQILSLLRFTQAPCTHALGLGGEPKCFWYPDSPAEGTTVDAFFLGTCEAEWRTELEPVVDSFLLREAALYAVVDLNLEAPIWGVPYIPQPEYGVILSMSPAGAWDNQEPVGVLLGVEADGSVTYMDYVCIGPPDFFLSPEAAPAYGDSLEIILRGPAFETPKGTESGDPALDAVIAALRSHDRAAIEPLFQMTTAPCTNDTGLGGPPKCEYAPGAPPAGTLVEAFPTASCEGSWAFEITRIVEGLIEHEPELYAVIERASVQPSDGYPAIEHDVVLTYEHERIGARTIVVGVTDGRIRSTSYLCISPPSFRLEHLEPRERLILYGPAFP